MLAQQELQNTLHDKCFLEQDILEIKKKIKDKEKLERNYQQTTTENETLSQEIKVLQQEVQNLQKKISGLNELKEKIKTNQEEKQTAPH